MKLLCCCCRCLPGGIGRGVPGTADGGVPDVSSPRLLARWQANLNTQCACNAAGHAFDDNPFASGGPSGTTDHAGRRPLGGGSFQAAPPRRRRSIGGGGSFRAVPPLRRRSIASACSFAAPSPRGADTFVRRASTYMGAHRKSRRVRCRFSVRKLFNHKTSFMVVFSIRMTYVQCHGYGRHRIHA